MLPVSTLSSDARSLEWGLMIWIPNMLQVLLGTRFEKPCSRALTLNWSTPTCGGQNFARGEGSERVHWNLSTPPYLYVFFPKTPLRFPSEHAARQSPLSSHIALSHFAKEKHAPHPFLALTSSVKPLWILNKCSKVQPTPLLIRAPEVSLSIFAVDGFLRVCVCVSGSVISNSATPWTIAHQAPLSMGFSRQGYWSGLPCPPPGDLPNPGIKLGSPVLQADSLLSEPPGKPYSLVNKK